MQSPQKPYNPPISAPTGELSSPYMGQLSPGQNDSGMGAQSVLPAELRGRNGGAFFLTLFWCISHSVWIGLLCLIPYVGWIMSFVMLFKGNELAWQNRKWESIEQFKTVQRKWANWSAVIFLASIALTVLAVLALSRMGALSGPAPAVNVQPFSP